MSKKKTNTPSPAPKKRKITAAQRKARKNVANHSVILFWFTAIALVLLFVGRWVVAISNGYYGAFVEMDASVSQAARNMTGLDPTDAEDELLLPLQREWDLYTSSRLRDEVTVTAQDFTQLHGYLYNEGSSVTVVVLPRFYQDGTADFLPGPWLNQLTGCNILLIDPRLHGGSAGHYFSFGVREQQDLAAWLAWADETLGRQTFILWGEGTGANTALMAEANGLLPDNVAFLVAESPYASLHQLAKEHIWTWYSVPSVPFLPAIEWKLARSNAGFTVKDLELGALLSGSECDLPVLFLQSEADAYILPAWTQAVSDRYSGPQATISGGGTHGTVYAAQLVDVQNLLTQWWAYYGQ